jgi:DnaJ-class molecular chaperone
MQYHPDKVPPEEREEAMKKFRDIAEAHEILTDPGGTGTGGS